MKSLFLEIYIMRTLLRFSCLIGGICLKKITDALSMGNSKMIPSTFSSNHPIPQNRHPNELAHYRHNVLLEVFPAKVSVSQ